jgi:hypothetical protein
MYASSIFDRVLIKTNAISVSDDSAWRSFPAICRVRAWWQYNHVKVDLRLVPNVLINVIITLQMHFYWNSSCHGKKQAWTCGYLMWLVTTLGIAKERRDRSHSQYRYIKDGHVDSFEYQAWVSELGKTSNVAKLSEAIPCQKLAAECANVTCEQN